MVAVVALWEEGLLVVGVPDVRREVVGRQVFGLDAGLVEVDGGDVRV